MWQALPFKRKRHCTCKTGQMDMSPPTSPRGRTPSGQAYPSLSASTVVSKGKIKVSPRGESPAYLLLAFCNTPQGLAASR